MSSILCRGKIFIFSIGSRLAMGSTQPPIQRVISPGINLEEREAGHSRPSSAKVKDGEAVPPLPHSLRSIVLK
jgi:hypothetical protein